MNATSTHNTPSTHPIRRALGILAAIVLASLAFGFTIRPLDLILMGFVAVLSLLSVGFYLVEWVRHMSELEQGG